MKVVKLRKTFKMPFRYLDVADECAVDLNDSCNR
jgi:hypothetical protein